jgi:hypothetical protein
MSESNPVSGKDGAREWDILFTWWAEIVVVSRIF